MFPTGTTLITTTTFLLLLAIVRTTTATTTKTKTSLSSSTVVSDWHAQCATGGQCATIIESYETLIAGVGCRQLYATGLCSRICTYSLKSLLGRRSWRRCAERCGWAQEIVAAAEGWLALCVAWPAADVMHPSAVPVGRVDGDGASGGSNGDGDGGTGGVGHGSSGVGIGNGVSADLSKHRDDVHHVFQHAAAAAEAQRTTMEHRQRRGNLFRSVGWLFAVAVVVGLCIATGIVAGVAASTGTPVAVVVRVALQRGRLMAARAAAGIAEVWRGGGRGTGAGLMGGGRVGGRSGGTGDGRLVGGSSSSARSIGGSRGARRHLQVLT